MSPSRARRLAVVAATAVGATALVPVALAVPALAAPAVPADLAPLVTRTSLTGTHAWYRQTFHGLPVLDSFYVQHFDKAGALRAVDDGRQAVPASLATTATVAATAATSAAGATVAAAAANSKVAASGKLAKNSVVVPDFGAATTTLAVVGGASPALVWSVVSTSASGESRTLVDARTGAVRGVTVMSKNADGRGRVFDPNPVVKTQNESLTDQNDSNAAVPNSTYSVVSLPRLSGSGTTLKGAYATVSKANIAVATSSNRVFNYLRNDDRFEQVNAYYGIDKAQAYIQSLGFTDVNNESQKLSIDTYSGDNSFYSPGSDLITYGVGGVDDAEDLEVVWHEYGHAIQDAQVPGFGSSTDAGAIGEGFGDYWAVTMSEPTSNGFELPCVMDWDATSYTSTVPHCLRRTDTGKTTDDRTGEVHDDGEIWSNALWDINLALGETRADTIILEAQFDFAPNTTFAAAATATVNTANELYGRAVAGKVKKAFQARKIL